MLCEKKGKDIMTRHNETSRMTVHLGGQPIYDIVLTDSFGGLCDEVKGLFPAERKACIVTDSHVEQLYLSEVQEILSRHFRGVTGFVFAAGEEQKSLDTVQRLYETLILHHFDRKDLLVALGGGVTGDLCGYGAATYLRGIDFIQIPTTLLSQVDSSIGGKTGVDFRAYKNMVGAFHMPRLVYTNVATLRTLSEEQYSSGMGEILKHGLIKDEGYYQWLLAHREQICDRDLSVCMRMIERSCQIKRQVVEADPKEQGERALLNFGHTLGHAIEKQMKFTMLHGHCVGLGCLAAMGISVHRGQLPQESLTALRQAMEAFGMPVSFSGLDLDDVIRDTKNDKKMDGDTIRFILLRSVGEAYIDRSVTEAEMRTALEELSV